MKSKWFHSGCWRDTFEFVACNFQEKGTEKIFYGLDNIADADEIIIVNTWTLAISA